MSVNERRKTITAAIILSLNVKIVKNYVIYFLRISDQHASEEHEQPAEYNLEERR